MPGATRTLSYDGLQRPTRITSQAIGQGTHENPAGATIMEYRYAYDAAGNITERDTEDGAYQYGYDLIDRLTQATPPPALQQDPLQPAPEKLPVEAYSYDPVHNRLTSQHQPGTWQYNADNQLLQYGIGPDQHSYTYNPNGHTATEITGDPATRTREFIYNAAERLTEIKDNGQPIGQYQYDPMGRRIKKQTQEGTIWFLYADEGLIAELGQTGNPTRYYGWKPNGLWGTDPLWLADKAGSEWQTHLYHNDHLWTPQRLTDTSGEVTWSGRAEAFGKTAAIVNQVEHRLRFPGQYEDRETGLYYNWNRDYLAAQGRYVQSDPIALFGGINLYLYTSTPTKEVDNHGLAKWSGSVVSIGAAYGVGASFNKLDLTSECECGKKWEISVITMGPTVLGLGGSGTNPFGGNMSNTEFEDDKQCPTPSQFEGLTMWTSGGFAALVGGGCSMYLFGLKDTFSRNPRFTGAHSASCGKVVGFDASVGISIGSSTVISQKKMDCEECNG